MDVLEIILQTCITVTKIQIQKNFDRFPIVWKLFFFET